MEHIVFVGSLARASFERRAPGQRVYTRERERRCADSSRKDKGPGDDKGSLCVERILSDDERVEREEMKPEARESTSRRIIIIKKNLHAQIKAEEKIYK